MTQRVIDTLTLLTLQFVFFIFILNSLVIFDSLIMLFLSFIVSQTAFIAMVESMNERW